MKRVYVIACLFLLGCTGNLETNEPQLTTDTEQSEIHGSEKTQNVNSPDRSVYIDEQIASEVTLEFGPLDELVYANVNGETHPVKLYEGTMMKASGAAAGYSLRFQPYDRYDFATERTIESKYDFDLDIILSRDQNDKLGFVDYTDATNNLVWDYFENLFKVYYYETESGNYPLKFINEGKTEWDG